MGGLPPHFIVTLRLCQIGINIGAVGQIEGNGPIHLFKLKRGKGLGNALSGLPAEKGVDNRVKRNTTVYNPIAPISLLNILLDHCFHPSAPTDQGTDRRPARACVGLQPPNQRAGSFLCESLSDLARLRTRLNDRNSLLRVRRRELKIAPCRPPVTRVRERQQSPGEALRVRSCFLYE